VEQCGSAFLRSGRRECRKYERASHLPLSGSIGELTVYFLRLGLLGFGRTRRTCGTDGTRELVAERGGWLSSEQMREIHSAICQSLPGPLAIQVGIYISYLRGGFWGGMGRRWLGFSFSQIFVIVAALGALYVLSRGNLQPVTAIFYGVKARPCGDRIDPAFPATGLAKLGMEDPGCSGCDLRRSVSSSPSF